MIEIFGFWLGLSIVIGYFSTKIVKEYFPKQRFRNTKSEFIADLCKMQQRWLMRGETEYAHSIGMLIDALQAEVVEHTPYAKEVIETLKYQKQSEVEEY